MSFDPDQLSTMITHAVAPVFLLGVIAAFVSILLARMTAITDQSGTSIELTTMMRRASG